MSTLQIQPFKRLLVPIDSGESESSEGAIAAAVELAKRYAATVTILHVYEIPVFTYPGVVPLSVDVSDAVRDAAKSYLDKKVAEVKKEIPSVAGMLCPGVPWEEILKAIRETHADLVVMGTHGRRGLGHALLGSVAEKVLRASPVPVLTVRK